MSLVLAPSMSAAEYRQMMGLDPVPAAEGMSENKRKSEKTNKFGAIPTEYDSPLVGKRVYASKLESAYAAQLDLRWRAGDIPWWLPQVPIPIGCTTEGGQQRVIRVDFLVGQHDGPPLWQDTKGMMTEAWAQKRDLVKARYGITIELVRRV